MKELKVKLGEAMDGYKAVKTAEKWLSVVANIRPTRKEEEVKARDAARESYQKVLAPIDAVIAKQEGRSRVRTITADNVIEALSEITDGFAIPKKHLNGVKVSVDENAQAFPNNYRFQPESTQFEAAHNGKEWVLTNVWRGECRRPANKVLVTLTDEAKEAILKSFENGSRF